MDRVSRVSGIKCSPHMMRYTFATMPRFEYADSRLLADYLGHKSTQMTESSIHIKLLKVWSRLSTFSATENNKPDGKYVKLQCLFMQSHVFFPSGFNF